MKSERKHDPRIDMFIKLIEVVKESLAELVMINAQMEKLAHSEENELNLDTILLKLYTMLIQLQSARAAIESETRDAGQKIPVRTDPGRDVATQHGAFDETTTKEEFDRVVKLPPISDGEVLDIEELLRRIKEELS